MSFDWLKPQVGPRGPQPQSGPATAGGSGGGGPTGAGSQRPGAQTSWDPTTGSPFASPWRSTGVATPRAFYDRFQNDPIRQNTDRTWNRVEYDKLPDVYRSIPVGPLGASWAADVLADPYNIPDDMLREMLENTELAYNRAEGDARQRLLSSGAGRGGVAQGIQGQLGVARGASQARDVRDWTKYRTQLGDERLARLWLPYMSQYNNAIAAMMGAPQRPESPSFAETAGRALLGFGLGGL